MFSFRRWLFLATLALGSKMAAQPALTTIQDILYTADGNRFNGLVTINWQSFELGDSSNIASQSARITITNGILYVQLVPTTTASTPATYSVQYNSTGHTQFTESWVVFPSITPLRVRDVRLSPGAVSTLGPPVQISSVQMSDVLGLQAALNLRLVLGTGFQTSRAAVINAAGAVDGAVGNLSDCLHVDGTSGACGSGSGSNAGFVDGEIPAGTLDGVNATFTLATTPSPPSSLTLFRNGMLLKQNLDYTLSSSSLIFLSGSVPRVADSLLAYYRVAVSLPGVGFVDSETPAGAVNGVNDFYTLLQAPMPAVSLGVYRNGIRLKSGVDYAATNNGITFLGGLVPRQGTCCSVHTGQRSRACSTFLLRLFAPRPGVISRLPYPPSGVNMYCRKAASVPNMHLLLSRLWNEEDGQDMIEYALLAATLVVVVAGILPQSLMPSVSTIFSKITSTFAIS